MRLHSFHIKGFKSIIDTGECKISDLDNIVVLAGQNEAGKTAVLEALDFFRNGPSKNFIKFQRRLGSSHTEVLCTFSVDKDDLLFDEEVLPSTEIDKFLKTNKYLSFVRISEKEKSEEIKPIEESETLIRTLFPERTDVVEEETKVDEVVETDEATVEPTPAPSPPPPSSQELFSSFKDHLIKSIPQFSLYTTFSDLLPSEIEVTDLPKNKAVLDFEKVFGVKLAEYAQITDHRDKKIKLEALETLATDDFNKSWTQTIASIKEDRKYTFSIVVDNAEPQKVVFMIKGKDGTPLYLEQKSMGFRWFSAFHLRLRSLMKDGGDLSSASSGTGTQFILLIDEPGQNLHDIAQRDVKKILEETAGKKIQIIYSTHNPNLIGTEGNEFTRIRLVSNDESLGTKIENVAQFISKQNRGSLDALSPIRTAMGLVNVQSIFDSNKFNVVVEGITDHYYLSAFQKLLNKDNRIHFVPSCGVDNVKHLVSVMVGWGCNYRAVFDDDPSQGRKAYNQLKKQFYEDSDELAHVHILKLSGCNGIEDVFSNTDFENLVLGKKRAKTESKKKNSELVKDSGKEMYARMFLEKVQADNTLNISDTTKNKVEELFKWIYGGFGIT